MTGPYREFEVAEVADDDTTGPVFKLAGIEFQCLPVLPAAAWLATNPASMRWQVHETVGFIRACVSPPPLTTPDQPDQSVVPNQEARFNEVVTNKRRPIPGPLLGDVVDFLIESYAGVPTAPPVASTNGSAPMAGGSAGGSLAGSSDSGI